MSFDLIFCSHADQKVAPLLLFEYFKSRPFMSCSQDKNEFQAMYQNPSTGVYGVFNFSPLDKADVPSSFIEMGATGLSVSINYLRPSFFALELMPEIETFCKAKNLLVLDPQDSEIGGEGKPKPCVASECMASWEKGNQFAILSASQGSILPPYLDKEKSVYLWQYMNVKNMLEKRFENEDIFVPQIVVVRRGNDVAVKTAITWGDGVSLVLPYCDIIIFQKIHSKGFLGFRKNEEMGWADFETIVGAIQQFLRKYTAKDFPSLDLRVLYKNVAEWAREIILKVPFKGALEEWQAVAMDGFVDMKSEAAQ